MTTTTPEPQLGLHALETLQRISLLLLEDHDADTLCQSIFPLLNERTNVDVYFHYLIAPSGEHLELASAAGNARLRAMLGSRLAFGQAVCGLVVQRREPMRLAMIQHRNDDMTSIVRESGIKAYACFPLVHRGEALGTLSFGSMRVEEFSDEDFSLFALIAQGVTKATERRRQAEYLRNMEQLAAAGRMSAALAHEINNPLESLSSVLYLLQDEVAGNSGHELLAMATEQVSRLAETARRTLETFRGAGTVAKATDLTGLLHELAANIQLPRDTKLVTSIEDELCVQAVAGELRQVLFNLLLNAAQFSPLGAEVTLTANKSGEYAELRVSDLGEGISEPSRSKLFQPFYTTRAKGGTGIGLWLSHELVERNGGTLRFESNPELEPGTTFIIRLPLLS